MEFTLKRRACDVYHDSGNMAVTIIFRDIMVALLRWRFLARVLMEW